MARQPPKPLPAIDDAAGWQAWMQERLAMISEENEHAWMASLVDPGTGAGAKTRAQLVRNYALNKTIRDLKSVFPARSWIAPNGRTYRGHALPEAVLEASHPNPDNRRVSGHLLNMAVALQNTDPKDVRWLMASGFNPIQFNPHTQNTPVGNCAYTGKVEFLRIFRKAGFDLSLILKPEHLEDPQGKQAKLVGTTLLHRIVERHPRMDADKGDAVLRELLLAGLDPRQANAGGQTALSLATGTALELIQQWIAQEEQKQLDTITPESPNTGSRRKPRL